MALLFQNDIRQFQVYLYTCCQSIAIQLSTNRASMMKTNYSHLTDQELLDGVILWTNKRENLGRHLKNIRASMTRKIQALLDEQQTRLLNNHK